MNGHVTNVTDLNMNVCYYYYCYNCYYYECAGEIQRTAAAPRTASDNNSSNNDINNDTNNNNTNNIVITPMITITVINIII